MSEIKIKESPSTLKTSPSTCTGEEVRISPRTGKPIDKNKSSTKNKRKRGNPKAYLKSPVIGDNGLTLEEGDNTKYLSINMELLNMPDIDINNAEEVGQRLSDYFALYARYDTKPTVAGMAIALNGMSRQTLVAIAHNYPTGGAGYKTALPQPVAEVIKKAYFLLENLYENYMQNGKLNPVTGIFLGKNNYGYQDKTEYVVTPNQQNDNDYSVEEIKKRYLTNDSTKQLPTID